MNQPNIFSLIRNIFFLTCLVYLERICLNCHKVWQKYIYFLFLKFLLFWKNIELLHYYLCRYIQKRRKIRVWHCHANGSSSSLFIDAIMMEKVLGVFHHNCDYYPLNNTYCTDKESLMIFDRYMILSKTLCFVSYKTHKSVVYTIANRKRFI